MVKEIKAMSRMPGFFKCLLIVLLFGIGGGAVINGGSIEIQGVKISFGDESYMTLNDAAHGQVFWVDNISFDKNTASAFYGEVFGWDSTETSSEFDVFANRSKLAFGGAYELDGSFRDTVTPYWRLYIAVDDIEQSLKKSIENGASILVPTFENDAGKIAIIQDPVNAVIALIQIKK